MKIGRLALLSYFTLSISQINGFSIHHQNYVQLSSSVVRTTASPIDSTASRSNSNNNSLSRSSQSLRMSTTSTSSGRTSEEIERELSSGRTLEDGPVIDFGSVKDTSSKAEIALANARKEYLNNLQHKQQPIAQNPPQFFFGTVSSDSEHSSSSSLFESSSLLESSSSSSLNSVKEKTKPGRLMGINDEVVAEVGREVGAFVNDDVLIQKCAAYLRSKAPKGMFSDHTETAASISESELDVDTLNSLIQESYKESGVVTEAFAKTFYLGTQLLPKDAQEAIWAVYVWCRRTDEIVDAPRLPDDVNMLTDLSAWEIRLENLFRYGIVEDVLDLPLLDCKIKYPNLPIEPFVDMIRGMLMDIPDLGQDRYDTFEELHLYCYRVAGTVGLMSMPIFGCAPGYTEDIAKEPALSLGVAFQLTNILRDVGEDAVKRGRIYLPREDMEKFGVTDEQIFATRMDDNYVAMMKYQIERARLYYDRALRGVPMLSPYSRLPVQSSLDCYGKILDKIEENGYDTLNYRAYVSKQEKMLEIPFSWYRTQDISKVLPIPGDKKPTN